MNGDISLGDGLAVLVAVATTVATVARLYIAPLRLQIEENKQASIGGFNKLMVCDVARRADIKELFEKQNRAECDAAYERGLREGKKEKADV